jgi:hypothetical protein
VIAALTAAELDRSRAEYHDAIGDPDVDGCRRIISAARWRLSIALEADDDHGAVLAIVKIDSLSILIERAN